jgi:Lon protease-like protein
VAETVDSFPLFPLDLVLLPHEVVPLHIFEERYKVMIGECLDNDSEFGIVWLSRDGLREIGCTAGVTQVLERFDDGRMNILVTGRCPFRLVRRIEDLPYPAGEVELRDDEAAAGDEKLAAEARERYADLVERVTDERPDGDSLAQLDAFAMAATIEFENDAKQELLEIESEDERLRSVAKLFRTTVTRLEESERAAEIAKTNGHPRR